MNSVAREKDKPNLPPHEHSPSFAYYTLRDGSDLPLKLNQILNESFCLVQGLYQGNVFKTFRESVGDVEDNK